MPKLNPKQQNIIILCMAFLLAIFIPHKGHSFDMLCWANWAAHIKANVLAEAYQSNTDYPPLIQYFFFIFGLFFKDAAQVKTHIYLFKIVTLAFDFAALFLAFKLINKPQKRLSHFFMVFLSIGFFYNTIVWGQVDGILSALVLFSVYFIHIKQNITLSLIFLVLAVNFKLQAIIFVPLLALLYLPYILAAFKFSDLLKWILPALSLQFLILFPFWNDIELVKNVIVNSFNKYPVASMNAFNFWDLVLAGDTMKIPDSNTFLGLSYKNIGLILFFVSSFFCLIPILIKVVYNKLKTKNTTLNSHMIFIAYALIPMLFFFFNTQMHERYIHPTFLPLIIFSFSTKRYYLFILFSIAYTLNLERAAKFLNLNSYDIFIFEKELIATIFLVVILNLFYFLYKEFSKTNFRFW